MARLRKNPRGPAQRAVFLAIALTSCGAALAQSIPEIRTPDVLVPGESAYGPVDGYAAERSATATKTDTPIHDIPHSVQVVPRDVIEDQNALTLFEVLQNVSNVRSQDNDNHDETFVIRGFDVDTAVAREGVGFKISGSGTPDLAGVERVEVLKGPASVLYGTGDPGGFVNLVSKRPLAQPRYSATLGAGSFRFYRAEADLSGPLNESLRYRLNAAYEQKDSFRDYLIDATSFYLAPALALSPGRSTQLTLFAEYQQEKIQLDPGLPVLPDGRIADVPFSRYLGESFAIFETPVYQLRYLFEHGLSENWSFRSSGAFQSADPELGGISFEDFEDDGRTLSREFRDERNEERSYSIQNEIVGRIATKDTGHTFLAGFEYSKDHQSGRENTFELASIDVFDPVYAGNFGDLIERFEFDEELDAVGFYLQDQIRFSDSWILVAGVRYDLYQRKDRFTGSDVGSFDAKVKEKAFSPRVGVVYQPAQWLSFYANHAQSFRPQIGIERGGSPLDAERGRQFETGIKLDLFDQRLSATLAAFHIEKKNVLTTDPDEENFVVQTGKQRSRGGELDLAGEVWPGLNVIASLGVLDAKVTDDPLIAEGTRIVNAPRLSGRIWSTYRFREQPLQGLTFGGGMTYVGERNGDLFRPFDVPDYTRFDAFIGYRLNDRIQFSLNLENLTDKDYLNSADTDAVFPGAPFSVFGRVELRL